MGEAIGLTDTEEPPLPAEGRMADPDDPRGVLMVHPSRMGFVRSLDKTSDAAN